MSGWLARHGLRVIAGIAAVLALAAAWAFVGDRLAALNPFSARNRLERVEAQRDLARSDTEARALEAAAQADLTRRIEIIHQREIVIREATAHAIEQAWSMPDANEPIDPHRLERLRAHERLLCGQTPGLCPAATPDDPDQG